MKRIYQIFSMLAIAQFLTVAGFIGTLAWAGALTPERLESAVAALRGEMEESEKAASQPSTQPAQNSPPTERIAQANAQVRVERIELDRREREIADQWSMLKSAQMELLRDREQFEADRQSWEDAMARRLEEQGQDGRKRELELLEGLKADQAKKLLRAKQDADVVDLLMQLDARVSRKVISACKSDEELLWIGGILEKLRQRDSRQAEALTAGTS